MTSFLKKQHLKKWEDNENDFEYTGVEVVKIDKLIYKDNKFTGEILLKNPLKFNHNSRKTNLLDIYNKEIIIDTNIHVGLLTRNILITSEFNNEHTGYGANRDIWKNNYICACCKINQNDIYFNGPDGSIYSNYFCILFKRPYWCITKLYSIKNKKIHTKNNSFLLSFFKIINYSF